MDRYEAARALGVADADVLSVEEIEHGTEVAMSDGGHRLITADGVWACADHPAPAQLRRWEPPPPLPESANPPDDAPDGDDGSPPPEDGASVPSGTADEVLAWVGDDSDRAIAALEAEEKRDKPRATLVAKLEKVVG